MPNVGRFQVGGKSTTDKNTTVTFLYWQWRLAQGLCVISDAILLLRLSTKLVYNHKFNEPVCFSIRAPNVKVD